MPDWIEINKDKLHVSREKAKAAELRKTNWWQLQLQNGICRYCHKKFNPDELTMDHVVPVSRGGKSVRGNIVACCKDCNNKKKYLTPVEMIMAELEAEKQKDK